jgi:hypothetical protein
VSGFGSILESEEM